MAEKNENPRAGKDKRQAEELCRRWSVMTGEVAPFKTKWQEIAELFRPSHACITSEYNTPGNNREAQIFDGTPGRALGKLAGGLMSWILPANEPWFSFDPVYSLQKVDRVKQWLREVSELSLYYLLNSNFYTEAHEDMLNHCGFGTSAMFSEVTEKGETRFECLPVGSFCIAENSTGIVDTLFREFELTATQAKEKFGESNLPKDIRESLLDEKKAHSKWKFLHAVYPRPEKDRPDGVGRNASWGKEFASCYVCQKSKEIISEGGYDTFPFSVGRFLKWAALSDRTAYGYGPGFAALADARQLNFMQMMMDCAAEIAVRPPLGIPSDMEGELIQSAGGKNYIDSSIPNDRWPKALTTLGDLSWGMDRVKARQEAVNSEFFVQLFDMFANLDGIRTATEITERAAEKIVQMTPAFTRMCSEKHTPMLRRLFGLWAEAGMLPPPPPEAIIQASRFMGYVPDPRVSYTSRLALEIKRLRNIGFMRSMESDIALAAVRPEILDNYNLDTITRDRARGNGVPAEWLTDEEEMAAMRQARAEAAQAAQMAEMVKMGSEAVRNVGGPQGAAKLAQQVA